MIGVKVTEEMIQQAHDLALAAHQGQVDKLGVPYFQHVRAVAKMCEETWPSNHFKTHGIIVAYLHDIVEDTPITITGLSAHFPNSITSAVECMTHRPGESRDHYLNRVMMNWISHRVKIRDVRHNQSRLHLIEDAATRDRLMLKYLEYEMVLGDPDE